MRLLGKVYFSERAFLLPGLFWKLAEILNHAGAAAGLAGGADVAAVQDQPVVGVLEVGFGD